MIKNFKLLLLVSISFVACNTEEQDISGIVPQAPVTAGSANFSKYVALGNSLTAGFSDNALFVKSQENAYPKLMAEQFALAGGGTFRVPYMNGNNGGLLFGGTPITGVRLIFNGVGPVPLPGATPSTEVTTILAAPFNNLGVPGAKSFHLLAPGYGNAAGVFAGTANPYYVRFSPSPTTSVIAAAMSQNPTFFSLWIGANDVLGYALTGGDGSNPITPNAGAVGGGFDATYAALTTLLTAQGAKGVVANIPYVSTIPFFTTVAHNPVTLVAAQVTALNNGYAPYNGGLVVARNLGLITEAERLQRTITFAVGINALVIVDEYLTDITAISPGLIKMRQTKKEDLLVLSSQGTSIQAHLGAGNGTAAPLADRWVLSKNEVAELKTATDAINATILSNATAKGLAFVDANEVMRQLASGGIRVSNFHMTSAFVTGGAFSLDGVHLTARANAYIANKFIEAINTTYGSTLPLKDVTKYQIHYPPVLN